MYQIPLATSSTLVTRESFWNCVTIYHNRPHLVNRKILAAKQILFYTVDFSGSNGITDALSGHSLAYEIRKVGKDSITVELLENLLKVYDKDVKFNECSINDIKELEGVIFLSVRTILPRTKNTDRCVELVVIDKIKDEMTFFSGSFDSNKVICIPTFSYRIELSNNGFLRITVNDFEDADSSSAQWLQDALFSKIMKWMCGPTENIGVQSLSCISIDKYCNLYTELKNEYGESLRKVWKEKTKTDPQKFIFEDIAIASYLICIWDKMHDNVRDNVRFVDCGCGNGLLVYLLNKVGYKGYGIDIRKRNIWDFFTDTSDLRVGVVEPNSVYPTSTWLIGNHSDELTPWLPIIALRSSPNTNFFVLPCCPYDLNGKKYIRKNTAISQYADYLGYIENISNLCKFEVSVDKLRIPSTKRTCLIGIRKIKNHEEITDANAAIESLIFSKYGGEQIFKPRSSFEKVRNCTQIDRNVIHKIVEHVIRILLTKEIWLIKKDGSQWNIGGSEHLADLSKKLTHEELSHLKKECGGLQTLLRNHRYLFKIENGYVSLRKPYKLEETSKYRCKPCWYYQHHPNNCLYDSNDCGYSHC